MKTMTARWIIVAGALLTLGAVNYSIYGKEQVIRSGRAIYLELAPIDPRSLMQGDYMALRFRIAEQIEAANLPRRQRAAPLSIDDRGVATLATTFTSGTPHINFKLRNSGVWLGTNAYFFEEGTAARYNGARYGEFKLDPDSGEAVLVGLRDEQLNRL